MEDIYESLREQNAECLIPLELPDADQMVDVEEQILIPIPREFRDFLMQVSDVVCGSLEPVTCADPQSHTYLPEVAANAWDAGMPREFIPVCQSGSDYYCISQEGEILFWRDGMIDDSETWESIWYWARDVWLES